MDTSLKNSGHSHGTINRAGFRQPSDEQTEYWVFPEVFKSEICEGLDLRFVTKLLLEKGWLIPDAEDRAVSVCWLPGMGSKRCYRFRTQ